MRLLVLGGTAFLSRAVAEVGVARGHDVVTVSRGRSGTAPDGARAVIADRDEGLPDELRAQPFDAVVDVARFTAQVRDAVGAWPDAHRVFVSTISVYADTATASGGPGTLPLLAPLTDDASEDPEAYGRLKVACEDLVRAAVPSATIVRPGLIVGPGDPTGRFTYWPARLARAASDGGDVLAPGDPADAVQVIDVRDLAEWIVTLAQRRTAGTFDAVGPSVPLGRLLDDVAAGVGVTPAFRWVARAALEAAGVVPWAGPRSVPLWLPRPEFDGMLAHDDAPARAAGLRTRPVADTARDTLAWLRATPGATVTGLTAAEEAAVLAGR